MISENVLTFIIDKKLDPIIDCKYCNINLKDIQNDINTKITNDNIILNTVPNSGAQCIDFINDFLYDKWLKENLHIKSFVDISEYVKIQHYQHPDVSEEYFQRYYEYYANCFEMIKNLIYNYYYDIILQYDSKLRREILKNKKNEYRFNQLDNLIEKFDIENNYSFNILNKMYSIHSDGIYRNSLISASKQELVNIDRYEDYKNNLNVLFSQNVNIFNKLKILLKAYYFCYITNFVIRQYIFDDSAMGKLLLEVYNNTNFARPIVNFDVIF